MHKAVFYYRIVFLALISFTAVFAQGKFNIQVDTTSPVLNKQSNYRLSSPITLWAKDASLSAVLKVLAERSGMNFVAGEGANEGKITIILNATPLDEAINLLVRAAGLSYEIIGNSVLIAKPGKLAAEVGQASYVVNLKYVNAREVANMLGDLSKNIKVDEGGNRLICYTSPRVINEIEKIVKSIDHPHILVMLEARIIEVIMDNNNKYGIEWSNFTPIVTGVQYPEGPLKAGFDPIKWNRQPLTFDLVLNMLQEEGDARVLMHSKLTTTNNRQAQLHIGEVIPYVVQTSNPSSGTVTKSINKESVGLKVTMTPHINDDQQITLALEPEVSSIVGWKGPSSDIPLIRVRKTKTTVRVEDNQTIFLAGLLTEEESEEIKKLPLFGDIPLLGLLFQHRRKLSRKSNLIIEITPKIIYDSGELATKQDSRKRLKKSAQKLKSNSLNRNDDEVETSEEKESVK